MRKNKEEFSLKDLIGLFIPKLWLIVIVAVVLAVGLGVYSAVLVDDTYTSSSTMMIYKKNESASTSSIAVATSRVDVYSKIIRSDNFLRLVVEDINENELYKEYNWNITPASIRGALSFSQHAETELFNIAITTTDPLKSYAICNAISMNVETELHKIVALENGMLNTAVIDDPSAGALNDKNVVRNAILGFIAGVVLSMVAIFVHSLFDVTIRDRKKLEDEFDIPILGVIPRFVSDEEGAKK